jgi:hypothetical protein
MIVRLARNAQAKNLGDEVKRTSELTSPEQARHQLTMQATAYIAGSLEITHKDANGNVIEQRTIAEESAPTPPVEPPKHAVTHSFSV